MKNCGWTMAELVVAITILIIISVVSMTIIKPNHQKAAIYVYAAMKNLQKGNIGIIEKYDELYPDEGVTHDADTSNPDWYCIHLADLFSLEETPVCTHSTSYTNTTVNMRLPNGVTIQGLNNPWVTKDAGYKIKNIVVDIDGEDGLNKLGADRFPLRIYAGGSYDGIIMPIGCGAYDIVYYDIDTSSNLTTLAAGKSPYCGNGFTYANQTSAVSNRFYSDNEIISYDVFRPDDGNEETTASIIASARTPMEADCMAYGGGGFYARTDCGNTAGVRIHPKCANTSICAGCDGSDSTYTFNVCPNKKADGTDYSTTTEAGCISLASSTNPDDVSCFTQLHKPTGGLGFLAGSLLSDFDF